MNFSDLASDERTTYSIQDEHGDKSSIAIEKWAADLLQDMLPDVHDWVQEKYNSVCQKYPQLSRREKGNAVRAVACYQAEKSQTYIDLIKSL